MATCEYSIHLIQVISRADANWARKLNFHAVKTFMIIIIELLNGGEQKPFLRQ